MKRTALLYGVLLAFAAFPLAAQQAPDNDAILRETIDKGSPYYYPAIYMRYMSGDTTLTLEDYRHLYYGYAWQPGYKPFETPGRQRPYTEHSGQRFAGGGRLSEDRRVRPQK